MARDRYICSGIDEPMPTEQEFVAQKLTEWQDQHPTLQMSRHTVQLSTTRINRDGRQSYLREIIVVIYYNSVFARA